MKYKPCCGRRCVLGNCPTQASGGCYCLCSLKDHESQLEDLISGRCHRQGNCIIYKPGFIATPNDFEVQNDTKELEKVRAKIKEYEI